MFLRNGAPLTQGKSRQVTRVGYRLRGAPEIPLSQNGRPLATQHQSGGRVDGDPGYEKRSNDLTIPGTSTIQYHASQKDDRPTCEAYSGWRLTSQRPGYTAPRHP